MYYLHSWALQFMKEAENGLKRLVLRKNWKSYFVLPRKKKRKVMGT